LDPINGYQIKDSVIFHDRFVTPACRRQALTLRLCPYHGPTVAVAMVNQDICKSHAGK